MAPVGRASHLFVALACFAGVAPARADDAISYPYRGVTHYHRVVPGLEAHVVLVDLASSTDVVATRGSDRWSTVSMFAHEQDAQIAINANFFANSVCGLAVGDGRAWSDAYTEQCDASIAFGARAYRWRGVVFDSEGWTRQNPVPWATQIVSGMPILLQHGETYFDPHEPNGMYRRHPRTAVGVTADGGSMVIAVVDGRRTGSPGVTSVELIPLLEDFGVSDAINLDGGGSTALYIASEGGVVNHPSDGGERRVMNHLGVRIVP